MYIKRKDIPIFTFYIIAEKRANLGSHIASLKMHRTHAHRKFQKNGFAPAHRNLLPHIATRNLLSHIASHALVISEHSKVNIEAFSRHSWDDLRLNWGRPQGKLRACLGQPSLE